MPIEIVSGRSKSGKSKYIYDRVSRLVKEGREVMLIVPEQFSHAAEKRLLGIVDAIRDNSVEVFSFGHLATLSESRMGYPYSPKVNSVGKALIIRDILSKNDFSFYRTAVGGSGFADMVASAFSEMKKYMITPELLLSVSRKTKDELLRMKLEDLYVMYREYEAKLSKSYGDCDDSLMILAKRLRGNDIYKDKYVFLDGFSTFVPQELDVISALEEQCREVVISLCLDDSEPNTTLFMPTSDTVRKLKAYINTSFKTTRLSGTHFNSDDIAYLEKSLYTFQSPGYKGKCTDIKVFSLSNPLSEVETCASLVKSLIRENGYRYRDIGIVCSDMDMYARHIERVFEYSEIEYFLDDKSDIINHHLIRFILGILEIYINDYSYESVFNYLKACFVSADVGHTAMLERFIRRSNIRRSTWLDNEKWDRILSANYKDDYVTRNALSEIRNRYILPLANMHEKIKGRHSVEYDAGILYEFLVELKMPDTIAGYIDKFTKEGQIRAAKEYEKIWEIITSTLDETVYLSGEETVSPASFYELLVTAFSQHKVGFIPSSVDRVLIGNTERTRFDGIKALFVLGVNEGIFPVAPKGDGVLGDTDKESMKECGVEFSTTSSVAAYYSQFCAYTAFTMPSDKLFVSYSKTGNDFKTLRKSYIIDRICRIFSIREISELSPDDMFKIHSPGPAKELLCENVAKYSKGLSVDPVWRSVYDYYEKKGDFVSRLNEFLNSDNLAARLSDKNLKLLVPLLSYTSVSKIERYMACKYAYFVDYIMRIEQVKERTVDALDIGNITHMVLEKLSKEFGTSKASFERAEDSAVLLRTEELIDEYLRELSHTTDELSPRDEYTIKRLKNSIFLCFLAVKKQILESGFEPLGYEIQFNDSSDMGAIKIETDDGKTVNLTGKIDRADICTIGDESYIRVIDYKTGSKEFKLDEVLYGLSVQLMVYLNKLVSSDSSFRYGGALYFPVSDTVVSSGGKISREDAKDKLDSSLRLKGIVPYDDKLLKAYNDYLAASLKRGSGSKKRISPESFKTIDDYLRLKLGSICGDILRGDFDISPYKKNDFSPCEYCNYSSLCRFDSSDKSNDYRRYKSVTDYADIIKEMEEAISVDEKPTDSN